jgi:iron complex transport system ATP-binding protein
VPGAIMTSAQLEAIYGIPMGVMPHPTSGVPISFVR